MHRSRKRQNQEEEARRQSEVADVDVWHSRDVRIQSVQMARA